MKAHELHTSSETSPSVPKCVSWLHFNSTTDSEVSPFLAELQLPGRGCIGFFFLFSGNGCSDSINNNWYLKAPKYNNHLSHNQKQYIYFANLSEFLLHFTPFNVRESIVTLTADSLILSQEFSPCPVFWRLSGPNKICSQPSDSSRVGCSASTFQLFLGKGHPILTRKKGRRYGDIQERELQN